MNWTIERINDHNDAITVGQQTRYRRLNSHALFMINAKNYLPRISSSQRSQWQRYHSPRSFPNARTINNNTAIVIR